MVWKGKELETIRDLMSAMDEIYARKDKDDATKFMDLYRSVNEHANENIGYLCGYYDTETHAGMMELFDVFHPFFGRHIPTPEEAFNAMLESER